MYSLYTKTIDNVTSEPDNSRPHPLLGPRAAGGPHLGATDRRTSGGSMQGYTAPTMGQEHISTTVRPEHHLELQPLHFTTQRAG
jgi:hypothetical protein